MQNKIMEKISTLIISIEKMKVMKFGHPDHHKKYLKVAPLRSLYFREDRSVITNHWQNSSP